MSVVLKNRILKILFITISLIFIMPSVIYIIRNGTVAGFNTYYNFFINNDSNKTISTIIYIIIFVLLMAIYLYFIKKKEIFQNIKQVLIYTGIISIIFVVMLPWTTSDVFYYMGVGELNSIYGQNPYYVTVKDYYEQNQNNIENDTIIEQGAINYWADTTVVYGPIAQIIFSALTKISFKNIDVCLLIFKLLNIIIHMLNCYLIYKLTKKLKFAIIYGLNPYILLEFIGNVHNDIIVVFFILLSIYFVVKKKKILLSILFLTIATGIKYFTILLLPVIILYHVRKEEKLSKRFLQCIKYGLIFLAIFILEYAIYFRDINIFLAMSAQTERYCKSIYSSLVSVGVITKSMAVDILGKIVLINDLKVFLRNIMLGIFVITYIKFCIDLLTTKKIKFYKSIRKYNIELILFLLALSNFQQWYLVWLFATIPWQKPNMVRNIIGLTAATEIGNSIYMFKIENFKYDVYFLGIIIVVYLSWQLFTNKKINKIVKTKSLNKSN